MQSNGVGGGGGGLSPIKTLDCVSFDIFERIGNSFCLVVPLVHLSLPPFISVVLILNRYNLLVPCAKKLHQVCM